MKHHLGAGFAILALAATLSGCGSSSGTAPAATSPAAGNSSSAAGSTSSGTSSSSPSATSASPSQASSAVDLKTASSAAGSIVVDAKGMSLYFFTKDTKDSGTSACTGSCLVQWPPLTTAAGTPTAEGVTGKLGTISTPDGKKQVTLNGMPLYYFAKDTKPGDTLGQGRRRRVVPVGSVGRDDQGSRPGLLECGSPLLQRNVLGLARKRDFGGHGNGQLGALFQALPDVLRNIAGQ
ncbi:putative lipoprotein with Yx(FWY)xxD motif [Pseudarthrobacter defluvii]|nr:putative lipoprotein with Yx(FWY)xxD motif [Pseudarthrobacter defluvii]